MFNLKEHFSICTGTQGINTEFVKEMVNSCVCVAALWYNPRLW
jgi:hypothetical protein